MASKKSSSPTPTQVRKVLECTLALFKDKSRWTSAAWARDIRGGKIDEPKSEEACSWCLEGGLMKCSPDFPKGGNSVAHSAIFDAAVQVLSPIANKQAGAAGDLFFLNDSVVPEAVPRGNLGLTGVRKLLRKGIKALEKAKA